MLLWLLSFVRAEPMVAQEATLHHRALPPAGPHLAIDEDASTVWQGSRNQRASFWYHEHTGSSVTVTSCVDGAVKVRAVWTDFAIGPWTVVPVRAGRPSEPVAFDPARRVARIQVQLLDAHCVSAVAVDGTPRPARARPLAFAGNDRADEIGFSGQPDGHCNWFGRSGFDFQFDGHCALTDNYWAVSGRLRRQNSEVRCWMPGMPKDVKAESCPQEDVHVRWPVHRINKCMVIVNRQSWGRLGCW